MIFLELSQKSILYLTAEVAKKTQSSQLVENQINDTLRP